MGTYYQTLSWRQELVEFAGYVLTEEHVELTLHCSISEFVKHTSFEVV